MLTQTRTYSYLTKLNTNIIPTLIFKLHKHDVTNALPYITLHTLALDTFLYNPSIVTLALVSSNFFTMQEKDIPVE